MPGSKQPWTFFWLLQHLVRIIFGTAANLRHQSQYFNLTQQKDSSATARLTRSATLLAKLSVFFLPISFITSYFSIQIEDLYKWWNGNTYWYTFAVVATISFLSLFFFSRLLMFFSDVLDEWAETISCWPRRLVATVLKREVAGEDDEDDD